MDWEGSYVDGAWPWDLGEPAPPLRDVLESRPGEIWGQGPVLVPGCGLGHDAHAIAEAGHEVLAIDLAPTAIEMARERYGATGGLTFRTGDFLDPDLAARHPVSAIFEHTCFCAIAPEERDDYVEAASRWLPAGGALVGLFFIDPPSREDGAAGPPFRASREEIRGRFERYFTLARSADPLISAGERAGREWLVEMLRKP